MNDANTAIGGSESERAKRAPAGVRGRSPRLAPRSGANQLGASGSAASPTGRGQSPQDSPILDYAKLAAGFSYHVIGRALRPYQKLIASSILPYLLLNR